MARKSRNRKRTSNAAAKARVERTDDPLLAEQASDGRLSESQVETLMQTLIEDSESDSEAAFGEPVTLEAPTETSTGAPICDDQESVQQTTEPQPASADGDRAIAIAVDSNTLLLETLLEQVTDLRNVVDTARFGTMPHSDDQPDCESAAEVECQQLRDRITELEDQIHELEQQNGDLASQVACSNVRQTVAEKQSGCTDVLSWEERKKLILQQMEDESFDAEEFLVSMQGGSESHQADDESPAEFLQQLYAELAKRDAEIARRGEELEELRFLLDQRSGARDSGVAIGAAAIAEMVDSDELVQQERERLQQLQTEWEEKFREGEIEASLERAKLSRERQELAKKQAELEEQLEHVRRESRQAQETKSGSSRRWMAKLGLSEDDR